MNYILYVSLHLKLCTSSPQFCICSCCYLFCCCCCYCYWLTHFHCYSWCSFIILLPPNSVLHSFCKCNITINKTEKMMLTSYFVKYFSVPSLSERTNLLLRNCPLSRPLFINMPSLIPTENQQRSPIKMKLFFMNAYLNVWLTVRVLTFLICKILPRLRKLLPLILCSDPLLPQHP